MAEWKSGSAVRQNEKENKQDALKKAYTGLPVVRVTQKQKALREVVKTSTLEQDPPNHKIDGGVCLYPPCLTSKDGVYIA